MAGLFASSDPVQRPRLLRLALPEVVVPVGPGVRVRRPLTTCSRAMQRVRETVDSSGDARRGRQQEVEAHHKAMQYPGRGSHRYPTAAGPPRRTKIANLSEASHVSSLQSLARMTTPIPRDIFPHAHYSWWRGLAIAQTLRLFTIFTQHCFRKGDCV